MLSMTCVRFTASAARWITLGATIIFLFPHMAGADTTTVPRDANGDFLTTPFPVEDAPQQADPLEWYWQNPLPLGNLLMAVHFVSTSVGTAVGEHGTIIRTTDGGATWIRQQSGSMETLCDVDFTDAETGTAVGYHGTILRTTDGGQTWMIQATGAASRYTGVDFVDADTGTVVGWSRTILRTTDGGETWVSQTSPNNGVDDRLRDVCFLDANTGYAAYPNAIIRTTNGGDTWHLYQFYSPTYSKFAMSVHFFDASTGVVVGYLGVVMRTTNGGISWHEVDTGTSENLYRVSFGDANTGVAVGNDGAILGTTDGGNTWTIRASGTTGNLYGVSLPDGNSGTVVGTGGWISQTADGGDSWLSRTTGTREHLYDVHFVSADTGTVVGSNGTVLRTTDGGATWVSQASGTPVALRGVCFADAIVGMVVGDNGTILGSNDGGGSWESQNSGTTNRLLGVQVIDVNTAVAVGENGTILRTTDGGTTWMGQLSGTTWDLNDVHFTDSMTGTVVGKSGTILRTTDGGAIWVSQAGVTWENLNAVDFLDPLKGTIVGRCGVVLQTEDGGESWAIQAIDLDLDSCFEFLDVCLEDASTGTIVGRILWWDPVNGNQIIFGDVLFRTTDGGATWVRKNSGATVSFYATSFGDPHTGTIVGESGTILRMEEDTETAVLINDFRASAAEGGIELAWSLYTDESIDGFHVYRTGQADAVERRVNERLIDASARSYVDETVLPGERYRYTLAVLGAVSGEVRSVPIEALLPALTLQLYQNTPNPFNPSTSIRYVVPRASHVTLRIHSPSGRLVRTLVDRVLPAGAGEVTWDGTDDRGNAVASGVYFYRLRSGNTTRAKRMILLK